jgi:tocopherol O-methyltransferase
VVLSAPSGEILPAQRGMSDGSAVQLYYTGKTAAIMHKYGPGPRVHFHVGWYASARGPSCAAAQHVIQQSLVDSQETALRHAARLWNVPGKPPARLLDIGCGLGGGSIYWAQEHGSAVTGLTVTAAHVPVVAALASQADVADKVRALHADVHQFAEDRAYDAAVAIESTGYMDRARLFSVVGRTLRRDGWFGIQDHFLCRPEWAGFIDAYYRTRLGTVAEYIDAARMAGFELEQNEDITDGVPEFWLQSMAWTTAEMSREQDTGIASPIARERLADSALTHGNLFRIWRDHAVETRLLLFRLTAR